MKKIGACTAVVLSMMLAACSGSGSSGGTSGSVGTTAAAASVQQVENESIAVDFPFGTVNGTYSGEMLDGKPNGEGIFTLKDADGREFIYSGNWTDGILNGHGSSEIVNSFRVEGEFKDGVLDGEGRYYLPDGRNCAVLFENGEIARFLRESVSIEDEPKHYVQLGPIGFQIPESWTYQMDAAQTNPPMTITLPDEGASIIVSFDTSTSKITDAYKDQVKSSITSLEGYDSIIVIDEKHDKGVTETYEAHFLLRSETKGIDDVYCRCDTRASGTLCMYVLELGFSRDYYEAAQCIPRTLLSWEVVKERMAAEQAAEEKAEITEQLSGETDWDALRETTYKVSASEIINHNAPENTIVLVTGIIDQINTDDSSFVLWVPCDDTYYEDNLYKFNNIADLSNGDLVEIYVETGKSGDLGTYEGIQAIHVLEKNSVPDIVSAFKKSCPAIDYKGIMRNPDKAYGTICKASGTVLQVVEITNYGFEDFLLRLNDGNIVFVSYHKGDGDNILEDDKVTVYGTFYKTKTYTSLLGTSQTVPELSSNYVDLK